MAWKVQLMSECWVSTGASEVEEEEGDGGMVRLGWFVCLFFFFCRWREGLGEERERVSTERRVRERGSG